MNIGAALETWHRITFGHKDNVDSNILDLGIKFEKSPLPGDGYLIHIDINESDSIWPELNKLVKDKKAVDIYETFFTDEEIFSSEWVRLVPTFEYGYPQPRNLWNENHINYSDNCPECGKFKQTSNFRLEKEPKLGKNSFFCLYWTYTFFAENQVFNELNANGIVGCVKWDAIIDKYDKPSELVSQINILKTANPGIDQLDKLESVLCSTCKSIKYSLRKLIENFINC